MIGGLVAFAMVLGVYLALVLTGHDPNALVTFFGGCAALLVHSEARHRRQVRTLDTIEHQTNGALTERINKGSRAAVRDALTAVGVAVPADY